MYTLALRKRFLCEKKLGDDEKKNKKNLTAEEVVLVFLKLFYYLM